MIFPTPAQSIYTEIHIISLLYMLVDNKAILGLMTFCECDERFEVVSFTAATFIISSLSPFVVHICIIIVIVIVSSSKSGQPKSIGHQITRLKHKLWYEDHPVTLTRVLSKTVEGKHR